MTSLDLNLSKLLRLAVLRHRSPEEMTTVSRRGFDDFFPLAANFSDGIKFVIIAGLQNGVKAMIVIAFVVVALVVVYAILYQVQATL